MLEMKILAPQTELHMVSSTDVPREPVSRPTFPLLLQEEHRAELIEGLLQPQKRISGKYLNDEIGSEIFSAIANLPEYYPAHTESALLRHAAPMIAEHMPCDSRLIEFGCGAFGSAKLLIEAIPHISSYVPIDLCPTKLQSVVTDLTFEYPGLSIQPIQSDLDRDRISGHGVNGYGSIGYASGASLARHASEDVSKLLKWWRSWLGTGSRLVVGIDLSKDTPTLVRAREDWAGLTAAYNLNLLARLNRELNANFDLGMFSHRAIWNSSESRVEMHLVSEVDQKVEIAGVNLRFASGETINTDNSYVRDFDEFQALAADAGWKSMLGWVSGKPSYALLMFEAT